MRKTFVTIILLLVVLFALTPTLIAAPNDVPRVLTPTSITNPISMTAEDDVPEVIFTPTSIVNPISIAAEDDVPEAV